MRNVAAAIAIASGGAAFADSTNRNLLPIGEAESLRSNAGIAGASPGSVFHNPAGLARIEHPQLAVSGTTLMYFRLRADRFLELDEPVPYEAVGFAPIPASLVSTYELGSYALATAILVPDMFQLDNRQRRSTPSAQLTLAQSTRRQDLWLGAGIARMVGERVAVGLSAYAVRRTNISSTFFQISVPAMEGVFTQTTSSETTSVLGVTAILGVSVEATPWLTIGLRVEPPFLQLAGSASIFQSQISNDGMTTQLAELDKEDIAISQPVPADFGVGLAIRAAASVTVYLDAAVQLPLEYTFVDDPELGPPQDVTLETALRSSAGVDVRATDKLMLHAGMQYNRGARRRLELPGDTIEDYVGGSIGATRVGKRSRTGVGAFVLRSASDFVPIGGTPDDLDTATTTVIGVLLTVGYLL